MSNEEAIKYLIPPVATSSRPSAEYLRQKEAYELAIKALQNERPHGKWVRLSSRLYKCKNCGYIADFKYPFCHCGADMRKGGAE